MSSLSHQDHLFPLQKALSLAFLTYLIVSSSVTSAFALDPTIQDVGITFEDISVVQAGPIYASVGGHLRLWYFVNNPTSSSINIILGASIRASGGSVTNDSPRDKTVLLSTGSMWYSRDFYIGSSQALGTYDVAYAIWKADWSQQYAIVWKTSWLVVTNAVSVSLSSATTDGGSNPGGTITFDSTDYTLPATAYLQTRTYWSGTDNVHATPPTGYIVDHWESSGSVSYYDQGNGYINAYVHGTGGLKVYFRLGPTFDLSVAPSALTVAQGSTVQSTVTLTSRNSYTGSVALSLVWNSGRPSWVTRDDFSVNPVNIPSGGAPTSTLTIGISSSAAVGGPYPLTVVGTATNQPSKTYGLSLTVTQGKARWTVMAYLDGDNNLESYAIAKFLSMSQLSTSADVRIVAQLDRRPGYDTRYDDWTDTRRFLITQGVTPTIANTLQDLGEQNMGDPNTLSAFITWAAQNYPANHYLLILFDHGSGAVQMQMTGNVTTLGLLFDDTDGGVLTTPGLSQALSKAGVAIDVIYLDACSMGMVEVGHQIAPYASVMVASEEVGLAGDPDPVYGVFLGSLISNSLMTPATLATNIVNAYGDAWSSGSNQITCAAIDLTKLGSTGLVTATDSLALKLTQKYASYTSNIQGARSGTEGFEGPYAGYTGYYVDLYHFSKLVYDSVSDVDIRNAASNVESYLTGAVIAFRKYNHPNAYGLSILFPDTQSKYNSFKTPYKATAFATETNWDEWLENYYTPPAPTLSVGLVSPSNGATVTSVPITLKAQVTSSGSGVQSASVTIYVGSSSVCSGSSDSSGYYSCSYSPSAGGYTWYASASKSGYTSGQSTSWSFTYTPSLVVSLVSPPSPSNGATVTSVPITLKAQVTSSGSGVQSASVTIYVGSSSVCSGSSDSSGYYSCSYSPSAGGYTWYASASKSGYTSGQSTSWSFTYKAPTVTVNVNSQQCDSKGCTLVSQLSGVQVTLGSQSKSTDSSGTVVFSVPPGTYSLSVQSPVSGGSGIQYVFNWWYSVSTCYLPTITPGCHDNPKSITVAGDVEYSAYLVIQYQLTMQINLSAAGTTTPSVGTHWYNASYNDPVTIDATANPGYAFASWSGSGSGSYTGTSHRWDITMNGPITEIANFLTSTSISLTLSLSSVSVGSAVVLSGSIAPSPGAVQVTLSSSRDSGSTWTMAVTLMTDSAGSYSTSWSPQYPGSYSLQASWSGNSQFKGSTSSPPNSLTVTGTVSKNPTVMLAAPDTGSIGQSVRPSITVFNPTSSPLSTSAKIQITGPNNYVAFDVVQVKVQANSESTYYYDWTAPNQSGAYTVTVDLLSTRAPASDTAIIQVN